MGIEQLIDIADKLARTESHWMVIGEKLKSQTGDFLPEIRDTLISALMYNYVEVSEAQRRATWGVYAPFVEFADGRVFPLPLNNLADNQLTWLQAILSQAKEPALLSRINDLLWVRRFTNRPDIFARAAVDQYLVLADGVWEAIYRTECLVRSLEIGVEMNDTEIIRISSTKAISFAHENLSGRELTPGIPLRIVEALDRLPERQQTSEIDILLDKCLEKYRKLSYALEAVYEMKAKRSRSDEERDSYRKALVDRWREEAQHSKGLVKLANLRKAEELARAYGFAKDVQEILKSIQSIPEEEFEFKEIETTITIPNEKIRGYINWFFKGESWQEVLTRYGWHGPPSGDYKKNLDDIQKYKSKHPIQFLVSGIVLDDNNTPLMFPQTEDQHAQRHLIQQEHLGITFFGTLADQILEKLFNDFENISQEDLTLFFTTELISKEVAERIAVTIDLYRKEQYDAAAHILLTKIEAVFRTLARKLGFAVIRPPVGEKPGGVLALGTILDLLKGRFDESWRRYFVNLLSNPLGANIRNRVLHGLTMSATKREAALLIHAVCYLRLIGVITKNAGEETEDGSTK